MRITLIRFSSDSQSGILTRAGQQAILGQLPFSLTRVGPSNLHDGMGAGNYYIKLRSPTVDSMHLFTMYFLDSGAYAPKDPWRPFSNTGYDWIRSGNHSHPWTGSYCNIYRLCSGTIQGCISSCQFEVFQLFRRLR